MIICPRWLSFIRRGVLSTRVVGEITWRTRLVTNDAVWAVIDAEFRERAMQWGPLSDDKLKSAVDALVLKFDSACGDRESRRRRVPGISRSGIATRGGCRRRYGASCWPSRRRGAGQEGRGDGGHSVRCRPAVV